MTDNYARVTIARPIGRQRAVAAKKVIVRQAHTTIANVKSGSSLQPIADIYEGPYTVEPDFDAQRLETKGLVMEDDVTVRPIGVSITENLSGGNTVYIGPF